MKRLRSYYDEVESHEKGPFVQKVAFQVPQTPAAPPPLTQLPMQYLSSSPLASQKSKNSPSSSSSHYFTSIPTTNAINHHHHFPYAHFLVLSLEEKTNL